MFKNTNAIIVTMCSGEIRVYTGFKAIHKVIDDFEEIFNLKTGNSGNSKFYHNKCADKDIEDAVKLLNDCFTFILPDVYRNIRLAWLR